MEVNGHHHTLAALPLGKNPGTHRMSGWVGLAARLHVLEKRKISSPGQDLNPGSSSSPQPSHCTHYL